MTKRLIALISVLSVIFPAIAAAASSEDNTFVFPTGDMEEYIVVEISDDETDEVSDFEIIPDDTALMSIDILNQEGGDYAYRDIEKRTHPDGRRAFYNDLLTTCRDFMASRQDVDHENVNFSDGTTEKIYPLKNVYFNGITYSEAVEVYSVFVYDHPEFYWLSNMIIYSTNYLTVSIAEDYSEYSTRAKLNSAIEREAELLLEGIDPYDSIYNISKTLHDRIANLVEYGYKSDGVTPLDTVWAHNIVAVLDGDDSTMPVCEGYAKAYQLLLNYLGIENIVITGQAGGGGHMWNAVQLEDGNYYQVDVTWDDQKWGIIYKYFMSDLSNWTGRSYDSDESTGIYFIYALPSFPQKGCTAETAPTARPVSKPTPTPTPTPTQKPTATPTPKPTPTQRPTATPTPKPTAVPKPTLNPTPTQRPTAAPTPKPTPTQNPTAVPTPKPTPTQNPTAAPTPKPTAVPKPTLNPTAAPESTSTPTSNPTAAPESTSTPTSNPTAAPESTPTATPEPPVTPCFEVETQGNYTSITNVSDETRDATAIVATYDGDVLLNVFIHEITVEAGSTHEITHNEGVRVFVWDSLEKMHPLNL